MAELSEHERVDLLQSLIARCQEDIVRYSSMLDKVQPIVYVVMYRKNAGEAYQIDSVWREYNKAEDRYLEILDSGDDCVISDNALRSE